MRISIKIALAITLLAAGVLAILGLDGLRRETRLIEAELQRDARVVGESLAASLRGSPPSAPRLAELNEALSVLGRTEPGVRVEFLDERQLSELASVGKLAEANRARLATGEPVETRGRGRVSCLVPLIWQGRLAGAVRVTESLEVRDRFVARALRSTVGTIVLIVLLSGALALLLGRVLVGARVDQLVLTTRRVAAGDLTARLPGGGRDELSTLMAEVNGMIEQLEAARDGELEEAERRLEAELQLRHAQRLAIIGQLAAGIAHELGTPLTVIVGRASLIRERPDEASARDAALVVEQAQRVAATVRQLLDFARREQPVRRPCDATELAQRVLHLFAPEAGARNLDLRLVRPLRPRWVQADPVQMEQVISNLVRNAIQASPDGTAIEVEVRAAEGGAERVAIAVVDHGPGVAPDLQSTMFDPFVTTKPAGTGTGLGLSVVQGIVRDHGGSVVHAPTPGGGATLTVELPAVPAGDRGGA